MGRAAEYGPALPHPGSRPAPGGRGPLVHRSAASGECHKLPVNVPPRAPWQANLGPGFAEDRDVAQRSTERAGGRAWSQRKQGHSRRPPYPRLRPWNRATEEEGFSDMRRLYKGLSALGAVAIVTVAAHAQAPFADVPRDHWAYDAVNTLSQRGLIIGYPDGTYGGKRAMTRYEFAVVIARMLPQLEEMIRQTVRDNQPDVPPAGPTGITEDQLNQRLQGYVTRQDFDTLRRLVDQFAPELQMLQVDVANIRRDLADLQKRVGILEEAVDRVQIHGDLNVISRHSAIDRDDLHNPAIFAVGDAGYVGNPTDTNGRPLIKTTNLLEWTQILYNMNLGISAKVSKDITANTLLSIGNYNSWATAPVIPGAVPPFDRAIFPYGGNSRGALNADISPLKAYIEAPVSLGPVGVVALEAGKTGVQFTPYTLKLVDYDDYTNISHTYNGELIFTGLKGKFRVGGVGVMAYAGTHGTALLTGGQDEFGSFANQSGYPVVFSGGTYSPTLPFAVNESGLPIATVPELLFGARPDFGEGGLWGLPLLWFPATQSAGLHANLGTPFGGALGLTYLTAGINSSDLTGSFLPNVNAIDVRRGQVYGADLALNLTRGIGLALEYANSNLYEIGSDVTLGMSDSVYQRELNEAYDARVSFGIRKLAFTAGYKRVEPFFGAPGSWGQIGRWKNPTNIEGFNGSIGIPLTDGLAFSASAAQYESIVAGVGPTQAAVLDEDDSTEITSWKAGLKFRLTSANSVDLGVESVYFKPNTTWLNPDGDKAQETYYNLGFGSNLSENTSFKLLYQLIDYRDKGANFLNNGEDAKGSVAVGQFTVKF